MNLLAGFVARFERDPQARPLLLRITGSSIYRIWFNGRFVGHGPARAAHGHFRVDEWPLDDHAAQGPNVLAVEVAGYNVNSYALLDQPSFLQAEVLAGQRVLAATGDPDRPFDARVLRHRVTKVQRYSYQRPFVEVYRMSAGDDRWWATGGEPCACEVVGGGKLLPRGVSYPRFDCLRPVAQVARGTASVGPPPAKPWRDRSLASIGPLLKGFAMDQLEERLSDDLERLAWRKTSDAAGPCNESSQLSLDADEWAILDFGRNLSGFVGLEVTCDRPSAVYALFDEILVDGDVDFLRLSAVSAVCWRLEPGTYRLETLEPYTLRFLKLLAREGACRIRGVFLRELANPDADRPSPRIADPDLAHIYEAARQTFRQNAVDLPMDCPSRERAGWLCDSFFTSRAEWLFTGRGRVETNFLENYLLMPPQPHLPPAMLPMCYPADHLRGDYIPNWAMWFILQLREFLARGGDRELVDRLKGRVASLLDFLARYRNADGLLEKLDSWVFVEWSRANEFVQDVNYPTNMLYSAALAAAGGLYGSQEWLGQSRAVAQTVGAQSFDGEFFCDNAMRKRGRLVRTRNRTEVCQYYAFELGIATPDSHGALCRTLVEDFGPLAPRQAHPDVHRANAFIGHYLRLELLSRLGSKQRIVDELKALFAGMARRTLTLWEHDTPKASCNHGFASHAAVVIARDVLGLPMGRIAPAFDAIGRINAGPSCA
jgi:alpha-L-rhamnosidase